MKLALALAFCATATVAQAQGFGFDHTDNLPACVEKADAYKLALADIQGTLRDLWVQFVEEGRCGYLPATYLFSLDTYRDSENEPSRVVEMSFMGEKVWGIRGKLPDGVWMI